MKPQYKLAFTIVLSVFFLAAYIGFLIFWPHPFFGDRSESSVIMIFKFIGLTIGTFLAPSIPFLILGNWIKSKVAY